MNFDCQVVDAGSQEIPNITYICTARMHQCVLGMEDGNQII
jgi:hypothetical protein